MRRDFRKSTLREYFESIVIAVILALFIRTFVVQAFKIPTGSMENNLLIGDHLIVNKMIFSPTLTGVERALQPHREIRRGDVIVFKYPEDPGTSFVKRVVAGPGDQIQSVNGRVFRNGVPIPDDFISPEYRSFDTWGPETIPKGYYFVMGDHRNNSSDSRAWGYVPRDYIVGRVQVRWWPINHAKVF